MGAGTPPDLQLPRPPRWPPWALATSVVLHLAALGVLILLFVPGERPTGSHLLRSLSTRPPPQNREVLVALLPAPTPASPPATARSPSASTPSVPVDDRLFVTPTPADGVASDTAPAWAVPGQQPASPWRAFGSGVLWDRRAPAVPGAARTHAELTDSAVKAVINHYLDSLAALPGGGRLLPPSWKATIGGREYGIDGQWITVAGVKIPSLILALIPMPNGGNESKALDVQGRMRAQDYQLSLPRAATAAEQREEIRKIREREAAEHELNQQQREAPAVP
jgi:hypothetical protein